MELLEGEALSDRLAKGPLPLEQTLRYGVEIADALDKAHRQGIVHGGTGEETMSWRHVGVSILGAFSSIPALAQDDVAARIAGAALTGGGASAFLQKLTDSVGGRVTGSPELREGLGADPGELKQAGYANARFEESPLESRWTRGPASGRITSPIDRAITVGSYAWVPGTAGSLAVPLLDIGAPTSTALPVPAERVRGAAVLVDPQKVGVDPSFVARAALAKALADAGAAAMLIPSDKPGRMVYTSAFGFYPKAPLPIVSVAKPDALLLRRLLDEGPGEALPRRAQHVRHEPVPRAQRDRRPRRAGTPPRSS